MAYSVNSIWRTGIQQTYTVYLHQLNTAYLSSNTCMTRSSTKELLSPFENPEQNFRSKRRLFDTPSLIESNSPEFDHIFDIKEQSEEKVRETMIETMEQHMIKTREDYGSGVTRPTINQDTHFELKGKFLKELYDNTFSGSKHEDANERIEKEVILFYNRLDVPTRQILDSTGAIPSKTVADAKIATQKWLNTLKNGTMEHLQGPEDDDVPLILRRPFLSTAHSKTGVFKRKITLRVGEEKPVFKSIKPATSIIKRVFVIKSLDSKTKLIGEGNESFDPTYGNYIELNDLDTPLETKTDRDVDFEPTFVKTDSYMMKFSCVIGYKYVIADLLPSLSIKLKTKSFYYSIIKDKDEGKSHAGALIDIPIFVGSFSIISGFTIIDDDDMTKDVVLGMKFCKKYASCQMIMKKFSLEDKYERIMENE
ncbi:hypothetical protein Tco_1376936 [Tanacetum coccineum]